MSAAMDSSSNDDNIAAIVSLNNQFFYTHFFEDSDIESDDDVDLMVAVATVPNEENEAYMTPWRGSVKGRAANLDQNWENSDVQKQRCTETIFGTIFRCQGSYLGELLKVFDSTNFRCKPDATGKLGFSSY
jgi:hypothetical protein